MRKANIQPCKPCPFCGSPADEVATITGLRVIACRNYIGCGAYVSFDNPDYNKRGVSPVTFWNRRHSEGGKL